MALAQESRDNDGMNWQRCTLGLTVVCLIAPMACAHPVQEKHHDRTIVVRLQKGAAADQVRVRIEYRLEVDEGTVFRDDMRPFKDEINPLDYQGRALDFYAAFTKEFAKIYADRFVAEVNGKQVGEIRCVSRRERLEDEDGKGLGHLRCDFIFECDFMLASDGPTRFVFQEKNYYLEPGHIDLRLADETGLKVARKTEPSEAMRKRAKENPDLEVDDALREVTIEYLPTKQPSPPVKSAATSEAKPEPSTTTPTPPSAKKTHDDPFSLRRLIQEKQYGFWLILILAFFFGAAHALTPGHGKTLVAAYLVGERGTIWHAMFLGVVTTLTHTGVVLILAVIMTLLPEESQKTFEHWIENGLGLVLGLLIVCMGFWLLLQRLAGQADHFHVGGGHHHHHHHDGEDTKTPSARDLSWWGLVMLGVTGGMVPCGDAVMLLFYAVGTSHIWIVLPSLLAFSAGLAGVLVLIGILVVQMPRLIKSKGGDGRILRALPTVSAIAVILVGLWLCYEWSQSG
jgi:ABC-type nickel/cobalt efflux system permease component RcnA